MVGVYILNHKSLHKHGCALTIQARSIFSGSAFWQTETEEEEETQAGSAKFKSLFVS